MKRNNKKQQAFYKGEWFDIKGDSHLNDPTMISLYKSPLSIFGVPWAEIECLKVYSKSYDRWVTIPIN